MDKQKGVLLRTSAEARLNPYDDIAIEAALRMREMAGGSVTALTMGPPSAVEVLRHAYAMGVDEGVLLSDSAFTGADVLATAQALSAAVHTLGGADIVVFGRQTTDGDTAQVGPATAACLGIPCVGWVNRFTFESSFFKFTQTFTDGTQETVCTPPFAASADRDCCTPRPATLSRKLSAVKLQFKHLRAVDFPDASIFGRSGSATAVTALYPPHRYALKKEIQGLPDKQAMHLADIIRPFLEGDGDERSY